MATMTARSGLSRQEGRAVLTARGLHTVVDSPPPLGGPNEAMNPVDLLLVRSRHVGRSCARPRLGSWASRRLSGVDDDDAAELAGHLRRRCPVFTTLEKAAPIQLDVLTD